MPNSLLLPPDTEDSRHQNKWIPSGIDPAPVEWTETLLDGTNVLIRPIREDDVELERRFIEGLSAESRRFRFRGTVNHPSTALLASLTHVEKTEAAFVAMASGAPEQAIGIGRFSARNDLLDCECAIAVSDEWQGRGVATHLMRHLIDVARHRGIQCMYAASSAANHALLELSEHLGFESKPNPNNAGEMVHTLNLMP